MPTLHALRLLPLALAVPLTLGALEVATSPLAFAAPPPAKAEPAIDPKAMDLLKRSAEKLKTLSTFSVHAEATQDDVVRDGFKVQRTMTEDVVVRKPDRMRAEVSGDNGKRLFVYDGKSVSLSTAPENYYATIAAAPTLGETLDVITARYDLDLPLTDLLYMAIGGDIGQHTTDAGFIGTSRVAGVECDQLAFRTKAVDWQVWIERGALLPRKLVVTTRDASAPQYEAVMTWNTAPKITDEDFSFRPPAGALPMRVQMIAEPAGAKKPAK